MSEWIDVFDIFDKFAEIAPKSLEELETFEEECRIQGRIALAEYLWEWRVNQLFHIDREFDDSLEIFHEISK